MTRQGLMCLLPVVYTLSCFCCTLLVWHVHSSTDIIHTQRLLYWQTAVHFADLTQQKTYITNGFVVCGVQLLRLHSITDWLIVTVDVNLIFQTNEVESSAKEVVQEMAAKKDKVADAGRSDESQPVADDSNQCVSFSYIDLLLHTCKPSSPYFYAFLKQ